MRVKSRVVGSKMSVMDGTIGEARRMSEVMLHKAWRGYGIEDSAHQAEIRWAAPATIMLRLRRREVRDMLLSNWVALKNAYDAACAQSERAADHQEQLARAAGIHEANSKLFAAAAALAPEKRGAAE